jgi:hypothetical protein
MVQASSLLLSEGVCMLKPRASGVPQRAHVSETS